MSAVLSKLYSSLYRRTGATLKDTGIRDEHGLEPVPTFSSPEKPAPKTNGMNGAFSSYTEDVTMDVGDSKTTFKLYTL